MHNDPVDLQLGERMLASHGALAQASTFQRLARRCPGSHCGQSNRESRTFAELLIDREEDRTLRAVLVGMLRRSMQRQGSYRRSGSSGLLPARETYWLRVERTDEAQIRQEARMLCSATDLCGTTDHERRR
jgi:hypothetical protein